MELQGEIDISTTQLEDFNTTFSIIDKQVDRKSKSMEDFSNTTHQSTQLTVLE